MVPDLNEGEKHKYQSSYWVSPRFSIKRPVVTSHTYNPSPGEAGQADPFDEFQAAVSKYKMKNFKKLKTDTQDCPLSPHAHTDTDTHCRLLSRVPGYKNNT